MAKRQREIIQLFLGSPSDVLEERRAVDRVVAEINQTTGRQLGFMIEILRWEDVVPDMGRPQQVILDQLDVEASDFFVGILWNRFGTPTGNAASGTEEEFHLAYAAWQSTGRPRILLYFCQRAANLSTEDDLTQKLRVARFRNQVQAKGLVNEFTSLESFELLLRQHLTKVLLNSIGDADQRRANSQEGIRGLVKGVPLGMVRIPKGKFLAGFPKKEVVIDYDFYIDETPVTNADFAEFLANSDYMVTMLEHLSKTGTKTYENILSIAESKPDHPVVNVTWYDALTYAAWRGKRLPTSLEWEKAARGIDGRDFPWGNAFDPEVCNSLLLGLDSTTPVRQFPGGCSPFGCYDMAGNVFEWTSDWAKQPRHSNLPNSEKVNRGGSYNRAPDHMVTWFAESDRPDMRMIDMGFRCAYAPGETTATSHPNYASRRATNRR